MKNNSNGVTGTLEAQLIIDLTQTDLPIGTPVYIYIVGLVTSTFYYIDNNGNPKIMSTSDNTIPAQTFPGMDKLSSAAQNAIAPNYPLHWADYSIPVQVGGNLILNLGNINTTTIPGLGTGTSAFSGRVYFSVGVPKLPFTIQNSGYTAPVYGNGSGVTGSLTLYDWIEFSYDSEGNFNGNTTQVNQFGFPLTLTGTAVGKAPYPTQGALNTSRKTILRTIATANAPFGNNGAVVPVTTNAAPAYPDNINYLRAISPVTISGANTSMNTYFDANIATAYTAWQTTPLVTHDPSTKYYTGVVFPVNGATIATPAKYPAGSLAFYKGNYATMQELATALSSNTPPSVAFFLTGSTNNIITSNDIWQCANSLASGDSAQKNVGKMIGAAFNRGVVVSTDGTVITNLNDSTCSGLVSTFYSAGTTYNQWAKWFHEYNTNGLAYGFPYDDVCNQNPSIPPSGKTLVASFIRIALGNFFS
ncbi:Tat pathway signal protein [Flavobacterium arcticum]|uniref:Tat pathway signal protein n=1 Tax=Flavobacterium arcticum TaxID=1784713 RepID=A0A345HDZ4_9FLAO|nr:beta-1,3-glucanase family protein [Flavobacterium arcticum]AXG74804.1 Tat pathway signal protein [Flavobacterium arcticum]KAF2509697.1 Tat pathway signal protein [Flavobacterium arcticum]